MSSHLCRERNRETRTRGVREIERERMCAYVNARCHPFLITKLASLSCWFTYTHTHIQHTHTHTYMHTYIHTRLIYFCVSYTYIYIYYIYIEREREREIYIFIYIYIYDICICFIAPIYVICPSLRTEGRRGTLALSPYFPIFDAAS